MPTITVDIDIESVLEDITDEELLQELSERKAGPFEHESTVLLEKIYLFERKAK
jgi:hypothetical protein